jgi:hypothetical protein
MPSYNKCPINNVSIANIVDNLYKEARYKSNQVIKTKVDNLYENATHKLTRVIKNKYDNIGKGLHKSSLVILIFCIVFK